MSPLREDAKEAIALYAIAARDVCDFIDLVNDPTTSLEALQLLSAMLEHPGGPETDTKLNELLRPVVTTQIAARTKR